MVQEGLLTAEMHTIAVRDICSFGVTSNYRYFLIVLEDTITLYPKVP
jgi:hypothetical protein